MAGKKFSEFSTGATTDNTFIVGYDTTADTNNQYTLAQLATGLSPLIPTIYSADGTITTGRKALLAGTLQFRNAGDSSDIFKLNTDGTFALGLGASTTLATQVAVGNGATAGGANAVAIGNNTTASNSNSVAIGNSAGATYDSISIGTSASSGSNGISMGQSSLSAIGGIAIGYDSGSSTNNCINIGSTAAGTGANSITLNATGLSAAPSTASTFGVYMSSNTTPDFRISHDGDSYITGSGKFGIGRSNITATLDVTHYDASRKLASFSDNSQAEVFSIENNGTVKITGQAYTELHTVTSAASITPDWNNSNVQTFELTSASTTIVNPSNIKPGATYILILKQDSTGGRTVSFGTQYNFPADTAPTLTTTANKADVITLVAYSSTVLMCTSVLDFTTT